MKINQELTAIQDKIKEMAKRLKAKKRTKANQSTDAKEKRIKVTNP